VPLGILLVWRTGAATSGDLGRGRECILLAVHYLLGSAAKKLFINVNQFNNSRSRLRSFLLFVSSCSFVTLFLVFVLYLPIFRILDMLQ
jgi:hypothetical protein